MTNEEIIEWCENRIKHLRATLTKENPDAIDKALAHNRIGSIMAYEDIITKIKEK